MLIPEGLGLGQGWDGWVVLEAEKVRSHELQDKWLECCH